MTTTQCITATEIEADRFAKLAQFEFSPTMARFYRDRARQLMAEAADLRQADLAAAADKSWLRQVGRDADNWYNDRAAARMRGDFV